MKALGKGLLVAGIAAGAVALWVILPAESAVKRASTWQRLASPGPLSAAHASLGQDCEACHTALTGADRVKCVLCHASDRDLLQRQPTSFHAGIASCRECHPEHRGRESRPTLMDHAVLARIGLRQLRNAALDDADGEAALAHARVTDWLGRARARDAATANPHLSSEEAVLDCATCHTNEDRHFGFFGTDCGGCHAADRWTLPEFRHPSPGNRDCAQCHAAPPSHYMGHFNMVSAKVAGKPRARVEQCFLCHETTSWIDIKGVGLYKHH